MQKTKALHSSSLYKSQVRSLNYIVKGLAQIFFSLPYINI